MGLYKIKVFLSCVDWLLMTYFSLNATDFLERLRGQKLVFVGDSLNRNMWESLVCVLRESIPDKTGVYEISGRTEFKKKGFYAFRFEASFWYSLSILLGVNIVMVSHFEISQCCNCRIIIVQWTLLVHHSSFKNRLSKEKTVRLRH